MLLLLQVACHSKITGLEAGLLPTQVSPLTSLGFVSARAEVQPNLAIQRGEPPFRAVNDHEAVPQALRHRALCRHMSQPLVNCMSGVITVFKTTVTVK